MRLLDRTRLTRPDCWRTVLLATACILTINRVTPGELLRKLPPAPARPEIGSQLRERLLPQLESDDYAARQQASAVLSQGQFDSAKDVAAWARSAQTEGKIRALQIVQTVYADLLRHQQDDEAYAVRELIDAMQAADDALLGTRRNTFDAIHSTLMERASVRTLIRLNAVLEFKKVTRRVDGISKMDFSSDLPHQIFLGDNWLGSDNDLRHVELLLMLGENQFGTGRALYLIQGCPIPMSTLQDIVAGIPGVIVNVRSRARLGVAANTRQFSDNLEWDISEVQPGTSAAHAGIKSGDIIVRVQGKIVNTFEDLTTDLENYKPGDVIKMDVLRASGSVAPKTIALEVPESLEKFGLSVDDQFNRFAVIKAVTPDSPAEKLGFNTLMRIEVVNSSRIDNAADFERTWSRLKVGQEVKIQVRPFESMPVELRGWVGPYR